MPEELTEEHLTAFELFKRGFPNKRSWQTNSNAMKKIVCDFLQPILNGDKNLIEIQKKNMKLKGENLHYKKNYYDADFDIRVNELARRAKEDPKWIDSLLMTLVGKLMERTQLPKTDADYIQSTHVDNSLKPLKKLFGMCGIPIAWEKITAQITNENDLKDKSRGYNLKELQILCDFCDPLEKLIVKLGCSSGIRAAAYQLKWGHIMPVYQDENGRFIWEVEDVTESISSNCKIVCGIIIVYADSHSEYYGFVTPEWLRDLQVYKQRWIKETSQIPKDTDPLFKKAGPLVRELSLHGIRNRFDRVVNESSIRVKIEGVKERYNIPIFNGLRRFFNKQNKSALSNTSLLTQLILKEYQMGHGGLIKLDRNYFKEHVSELISEYLYTIPYVTIDDAERKEAENQKLREEKNTLKVQINENTKLQEMIKEEREARIKSENKMLEKLGELRDERLENLTG